MNFFRLVRRGLEHYRSTHRGVIAGTLIATATLVGALVVGDSVRHSLMRGALERIGSVSSAMSSGDRFFRADLAAEPLLSGAAVVSVSGVASSSDGSRRLHDVHVLGVDGRFFWSSRDGAPPSAGGARVNAVTAARLGLQVGDEVVVRVELPSALPRDMALAPGDVSVALRVTIESILAPGFPANFNLHGGTQAVANVLVDRTWLQQELGIEGRANLLLSHDEDVDALNRALATSWELADAQLEVFELEDGRRELRTERIFFDDPIVRVLQSEAGTTLEGVFTYFVNGLRVGERTTPYSMVSALGPLNAAARSAPAGESTLVAQLKEGELILGAWAAEDLAAEVGASIDLDYYVIDASRRLVEESTTLRIAQIVPLAGVASDSSLMPDFPGLADAENCRDWEPGTPVNLDRIRDKDELYWDEHGGTPKAFLTLPAGRELWSSRFGALTAVRFPAAGEAAVRRTLIEELAPAELGLFFHDVRAPALAAGNSATDFGGLFIGLSFFLIFSALLLVSQLFQFGVEQRSREVGLYASLGLDAGLVRRLLLTESLVLSAGGAAMGVLVGLGYTKLVLLGLATVWQDAISSVDLEFHYETQTLLLGFALSLLASMATAWMAIRKALRSPPLRLLHSAAGVELETPGARSTGRARLVGVAGLVLALVLVFAVEPGAGPSAAGAFFAAGAIVLFSAMLFCRAYLRTRSVSSDPAGCTLAALGRLNTRRRPSRSLATIALTAIGTFLVVAIGANRLGPTQDVERRDSGTGGFAFFGRSSLPVVHDLNDPLGREVFGLEDLAGVEVVPMRVLPGDDASCLNLARPQAPVLYGVSSTELARRGAFEFADVLESTDAPWSLLASALDDGAIPAIGDVTSLTWQLHLSVGDSLTYTDERGEEFQVRIVAAVRDSILQGALLIEEARFEELFPTIGGHRRFLIDAPGESASAVSLEFSRGLRDVGLALEPTGTRLDAFHAVQNSYLSIFQALGGLGLLLGSVGLGMLLVRNTLERRAELALMSALGFSNGRVRWFVFSEYSFLLALGLGCGGLAALVAVLPAMRAPGSDLSLASFWIVCALMAASAAFWLFVGTRVAVRGAALSALSEE